jgi:hypothetical protein
MKKIIAFAVGALFASIAMAKLPPPTEEAVAKSDEAKAKTEAGNKIAAYKLCLAQDKSAAYYFKTKTPANKAVEGLPACADPGQYVPAKVAAKS